MSIRVCRNPIRRIRLSWAISLAAAWLIGGPCASISPAAPPAGPISDGKTPAVRALENAGLKSDNESLLAYLAQRGDANNQQVLSELVRQLGASEWRTRDEATRKLMAMGVAAREAMEKAATDPDLEVRTRAKEILAQLNGPSQLSLVLEAIAERKTPGAVPLLLERMPALGATAQEAGRRALV